MCYGINKVPENDWICDLCKCFKEKGKYVRCPLCTCRSGILKQVNILGSSDIFKEINPSFHNFIKNKSNQNLVIENLENKNDNLITNSLKTESKNSKKCKNNCSLKVIPEVAASKDINNKLFYDYYKTSFVFSEIELEENEPISNHIWVHLSCVFWSPRMVIRNSFEEIDEKTILGLSKNHVLANCIVCNNNEGGVIKCSNVSCTQYFHAECARRVKFYFSIEYSSIQKFQCFCPQHTPFHLTTLIQKSENKFKENVYKFFRNLKKFCKNRKPELSDPHKNSLMIQESIKNQSKSKSDKILDDKNQKSEIEHFIKFLPFDERQMIHNVIINFQNYKNNSFVVDLVRDGDSFKISKTQIPPINILQDKLPDNFDFWEYYHNLFQGRYKRKPYHKDFCKIIKKLKALLKLSNSKKQNSLLHKRETLNSEIVLLDGSIIRRIRGRQ